jgi:hypothetical protein
MHWKTYERLQEVERDAQQEDLYWLARLVSRFDAKPAARSKPSHRRWGNRRQ